MADPITWGLINLVKKGVKGVQTTLDGVSDKVSGLPDSLDADFTDVKNAIDGVKTDTELIYSSMQSLMLILNSLKAIGSETNAIVKDIYEGVQINEWIADLKQSGLQSTTYNTPERMNFLISYESAVLNTDVDDYLIKYVVENNKNLGQFIGIIISSEKSTSVSWPSLTTIDSICKNTQAFTELVQSSTAFDIVLKGAKPKTALYSNVSITKPVLNSNASAKNILNDNCTDQTYGYSHTLTLNTYVNKITAKVGSGVTLQVNIYNENDARINYANLKNGESVTVNQFVKSITKTGSGSDEGCTIRMYEDLEIS